MLISYAEAVRRPPPNTPVQLRNFNLNQTNELFRLMKNYDHRGPLTVVRQFSCEKCKKMWWTRVRSIKQVSKCKKCKTKYDAIPCDLEFGCGHFECECSNKFTGKIQMGKSSLCFSCNKKCFPKYIIKKRDDPRPRLTKKSHNCDHCHGLGPCPIYNKILAFSEVHISTGSTLASLSNQNILEERFIDDFDENSEMPSIPVEI